MGTRWGNQFGFGQGPRGNWNQSRGFDRDFGPGDRLGNGIGGAVFGFAGRRFRRKMKKMFEDQVFPTVQADLAQARARAQALFEQQKAEQDAIAARYPERGCLKDQVVFLDGGTKTVPVSEIRMPVTMAKADDVVARLR